METLSVCIPSYNQGVFLEKAIRSVANQTIPVSEIIVSDDASTDNTRELLISLSTEIPSLRINFQAHNVGITKNVNDCLKLATGDYIIRLDSDDILLPEYSEKLIKFLVDNPKAGYAHAAVKEIDQYGNLRAERRLYRKSGFQSAAEALKASIRGYRVAANIIMFRKNALEDVGYLTAKVDFAEDFHLAVNIAGAGYGNVYLDETLSCYRVWADAGNVRSRRKLAEIKGLRHVFEDVIEPNYLKYNWSLNPVKASRTSFACNHANCLGWSIYSTREKHELKAELYKLSSTRKVKVYAWLYLKGLGSVLTLLLTLYSFPKAVGKRLLQRLK